ncbi:hypothetical protein [Frigidibacter oleivorans]|uniref:hypothetical protein n=1 Tax=Frigidibacter oleivorans TaxID=2487129 RepID=UPI000F8E3227|nr:hypothetical protein [Frigidibacter oleivorans]
MADSNTNSDAGTRTRIEGQTLHLDYATLRNLNVVQSTLVFSGGRPPVLENVLFDRCTFVLDGAAMNTQHFLQMIAHSGSQELVLDLLGMKVADIS